MMSTSDSVCEIVRSHNGKRCKLYFAGFFYVQNRHRDNMYYWRCEKRGKCTASLKTIFQDNVHTVTNSSRDHCHPPVTASKKEALKVLDTLKEKARTSMETPDEVVENIASALPMEVQEDLPSKDSLKRRVNKLRQSTFQRTGPATLDKLIIEPSMAVTADGQQFLMRDMLTSNGTRFLLFTTIGNIQLLSMATSWMLYENSTYSEKLMMHLFVIYTKVGLDNAARVVPLLYCIMSSCTESSYVELFRAIQDVANQTAGCDLKPKFIITDFHSAMIGAVKEVFTDSECHSSLSHITGAVWKYVSDSGLQELYCQNKAFSSFLQQIQALAFIPAESVRQAYDTLKSFAPPGVEQFIMWFEENYILGITRSMVNGVSVRSQPAFPPAQWSIHKLIENDQPWGGYATLNWHLRWERALGSGNILRVIGALQREQAASELSIMDAISCKPRYSKNDIIKEHDNERQIQRVFKTLKDRHVLEFLKEMSIAIQT